MSSQKRKPLLTVEMPQYRSSPSDEIKGGWAMDHNRSAERSIEATFGTILSVVSARTKAEINNLFALSLHHNAHGSKYVCRYIGDPPLEEVLDFRALKKSLNHAKAVLKEIGKHAEDGVIPNVRVTGQQKTIYDEKTNTIQVANETVLILAEALGKAIHEMRKDKHDRFRGASITMDRGPSPLTIALPRKLVSTFEDKTELTSVSGRIIKLDLTKRTSVIESQTGEDQGQTYEIAWSSCDDTEDVARVITSTLGKDGTLWVSGYRVYKRSIRGKEWFRKVTAVQIDNDYTRLKPVRQARN